MVQTDGKGRGEQEAQWQQVYLAGGQRVVRPGQVAQRDGQRLGIQELERRQHLAQLALGGHQHLRGGWGVSE